MPKWQTQAKAVLEERAAKRRKKLVKDVLIFHAGTQKTPTGWKTTGGRVLTVVGRGATYQAAMTRAYAGVACVSYDGMEFRTDIGRKAIT